jgi:hypothetical protein
MTKKQELQIVEEIETVEATEVDDNNRFIPIVNLKKERNTNLIQTLSDNLQDDLCKHLEALNLMGKSDPEKEESGLKLYVKICKLLNAKLGEIVYHNGQIKQIVIINDKYMLSANLVSIKDSNIKDLLDGFTPHQILFNRFVLLNYLFPASIKLNKFAYVTEHDGSKKEGFKLRKDLHKYRNNLEKLMQAGTEQKYTINHKTGTIDLFIPTIAVRKKGNKLINEYFDIVFGKEHSLLAKRHAALYTFENRYGISRPTLIIYGDRGTWKNLHIEKFLGGIYQGLVFKAIPNKSFNSYLNNKIVFYDETTEEKTGNLMGLYDKLKEMSGSSVNYLSTKYGSDQAIVNGIFPILLSNDPKPIHIKDMIENENQNQFLVIYTKYAQRSQDRFEKLKTKIQSMGYRDFEFFFEDYLGYYLWTDLFDVYKQMKKEGVGINYRYGMPIPITAGLKRILKASVTDSKVSSIQIIKEFYYENIDFINKFNFNDEYVQMFEAFNKPKTKGCIPLRLLRKITTREHITHFRTFIESLVSERLIVAMEKIKISTKVHNNGKTPIDDCIIIDMDKLEEYLSDEGSLIVYDEEKSKKLKADREMSADAVIEQQSDELEELVDAGLYSD